MESGHGFVEGSSYLLSDNQSYFEHSEEVGPNACREIYPFEEWQMHDLLPLALSIVGVIEHLVAVALAMELAWALEVALVEEKERWKFDGFGFGWRREEVVFGAKSGVLPP